MKHIEVVAGVLIDGDERVFCARRKNYGELALKWEFPGGKIEHEESHQEALIREFEEELQILINVYRYFDTITHQYSGFHLTLHCYFVEIKSGEIVLHEHDEFVWLKISELHKLDWAEADLPIVTKLQEEGIVQ